MRRFFYDQNQQDDEERIALVGSEAHHLRTVLRMRTGDTAELFDGAGGVAAGQIEVLHADRAVFRVLSRSFEPERGAPLTLAMALLKGQKMELVIQKATELGVNCFMPVVSRCCEKQDCSGQSMRRWQRIMLEACKQCRRPVPMRIEEPMPLRGLRIPADSHKIMPWEQEKHRPFPFLAELRDGQPVVVLIGPEGGFHHEEATCARESGFMTVTLGPRILRAETAALAAVVLAQAALS